MIDMLDKDQILTIAVIVSLVGISSLYLFSSQQTTRRVSISEIDETMTGTRIRTEGFVSQISWFSWTVVLTLKESNHTEDITVVFDRDMADDLGEDKREIRSGAKLKVEGKFEEYDGKLDLSEDSVLRVDSMGELSIEKEAYSSFTEISSLLENPRGYEGIGVKIRGDIIKEKKVSNHTILVISGFDDSYYELTCEIRDWAHEDDLVGKPTVVKGYWEYEDNEGRWKLISYDPPTLKDVD